MSRRASSLHVAVIGGGIIGISSALRAIQEVPGIEVTVLADQLTPQTTGDGAAGFWYPYLPGDVPIHTLRTWCQETLQYLIGIWKTADASSCGVGLLSCLTPSEEPKENPAYSDLLFGFRDLTPNELSLFPDRYKYGKFFTTFYAECRKLLPMMMKKFQDLGGKIVQTKVTSLKELIGKYDIVINCPGVGAHHLVPDPHVQPIRGQTIRVYAPWIKHAVTSGDFYILPNENIIVCGGTKQTGDWNTSVDPADRDRIWKGCCELVPSLKGAKIIEEWVGLRPGRFRPRLEKETLKDAEGRSLQVIHNYGHGGSGVTLFWGCAKDTTALLRDIQSDLLKRAPASKL